jgi:hypothetical protein
MAFESNWKGHATVVPAGNQTREVLIVKSAGEWLGSAGDIDATRQRNILAER